MQDAVAPEEQKKEGTEMSYCFEHKVFGECLLCKTKGVNQKVGFTNRRTMEEALYEKEMGEVKKVEQKVRKKIKAAQQQ